MVILKCKDHPEYQAKHKPQDDCNACWELYEGVRDIRELSSHKLLIEGRKE